MKPTDIVLAVGVAIVWGLAFVASKLGLQELSPAMFCALRFAVAALPCLFVRRPAISLRLFVSLGLTMLLFQFLAQSYGIAHGVPAGLMGVIVQTQALFTVVLAALVLRETPTRAQVIGIGVAMVGLAMICGTVGFDFSLQAFVISMISPISFSIGNLLLRQTGNVPMLDLMAWLSLMQVPPLLAISFVIEGPQAAIHSVLSMSWIAAASIVAIGIFSTSLAYLAWGRLLRTYTAAQVVPFALLVPFVGAAASTVVFGETFGPLRLGGMLVVVAGIAIMLLLGRTRTLPKVAS
ncbi:O-acetylserine/cysteine efflux transporter [Nitrobacteraceae bacterium AZCC 1564]